MGPTRSSRAFFNNLKEEANFFDKAAYVERGERERVKASSLGPEIERKNMSLGARRILRDNLQRREYVEGRKRAGAEELATPLIKVLPT